jgi:hypothetical protein
VQVSEHCAHTSAHPVATGPDRVRRAGPAWWLAAVAALSLASCVPPAEPASSAITLAVTVPARSVDLYVSGPASDPFPPFHVPLTNAGGNTWTASVGTIPAGPARQLDAAAFDDAGRPTHMGSVTLDVNAGSAMSVTLILQQYPPPAPTTTSAPVIEAVTATPGAVAPGGIATLSVVAWDPSGGTPGYLWSAGCGTFSSPGTQTARWTAPGADGICSVGITVSGPGGSISEHVPMYVVTPPP